MLKWLSKLFKPMPFQINQQAITNWQNWLNQAYPPATWFPCDGFTATMTVILGDNHSITFQGNSGYILKSFVNTSTGEIKSFDARKFYA